MPDPKLVHEGNLRLACLTGMGWPGDPLAVGDAIVRLLDEQGIAHQGPLQVFLANDPGTEPPGAWECHVGWAVTGMPRPGSTTPDGQRLLIEDYRQLDALSLAHAGPVADLPATWTRLREHAQGLGYRLRPYWRVALRRRRLADGNLLPLAEVAVFLDR
jgi:hypothetical protein